LLRLPPRLSDDRRSPATFGGKRMVYGFGDRRPGVRGCRRSRGCASPTRLRSAAWSKGGIDASATGSSGAGEMTSTSSSAATESRRTASPFRWAWPSRPESFGVEVTPGASYTYASASFGRFGHSEGRGVGFASLTTMYTHGQMDFGLRVTLPDLEQRLGRHLRPRVLQPARRESDRCAAGQMTR